MKRLLIITMAILAFTGCKSKTVTTDTDTVLEVNDSSSTYSGIHEKDSTYAEKNRKDSVYVVKVPATNNQVIIENPCDSLTGELRKFEMRAGKTTVTSNGKTVLVESGCDEMKQEFISINQQSAQEVISLVKRNKAQEIYYTSEKYINSVQKVSKSSFWRWWFVGIGFFIGLMVPYALLWIVNRIKK